MLQLLSNPYLQIYQANYISGDHWWLDPNGKNWWNRTACYSCDILYLCKVGEFDFKIDGKWYRICPGDMVYVPRETPLEYRMEGAVLEKYFVHFDLFLGGYSPSDFYRIPYVITLKNMEEAERLFSEMNRFYKENGFQGLLAANGLLMQLMQLYLQESGALSLGEDAVPDPAMQKALRYLSTVTNRKVTVREVAERVGYSTGHFSKKFKETFGCTPQIYMSNMKLELAKERLRSTDLPIAKIAQELGFCDASYFGNFFKAKTGVFPSYYRKNS